MVNSRGKSPFGTSSKMPHMPICLIQVPYMIGDERHGASKGPARYAQAAMDLLAERKIGVTTARVERGEPFRDSVSASRAVNQQLARLVRCAMAEGHLPLVLAGSCDASMGTLAGFEHARCGVIWFDAHGDFNTPDSTISGFFAGMSLAVITGHCYRNLWSRTGNSTPIAESATLLLGVRDLDPAERERLLSSAIQVVAWHDGKPVGDVFAALDNLAARVQEVYVHIDLDALDPGVVPGIVDFPVPGGLSLEDLEKILRAAVARFYIRAATLTTFDPDFDHEEKTLRAGLRIVEVLAEHAGHLR
jgi:arginase